MGPSCLVTCSKDTFLKLWDLTTQHCIQTIVAHRSDVWSLDVDPSGDTLLTGSGEGEVKAWKIDKDALEAGVRESSTGEVRDSDIQTNSILRNSFRSPSSFGP
jgi:U3 small nucleolar RNA-associated protein 12